MLQKDTWIRNMHKMTFYSLCSYNCQLVLDVRLFSNTWAQTGWVLDDLLSVKHFNTFIKLPWVYCLINIYTFVWMSQMNRSDSRVSHLEDLSVHVKQFLNIYYILFIYLFISIYFKCNLFTWKFCIFFFSSSLINFALLNYLFMFYP